MDLHKDKAVSTEKFKTKVLSYLNYTAIDLGQKIDKKALLKAICVLTYSQINRDIKE